ncbi:hypothetical protein TNIN_311621 [Trichonephila inaurata madagascariensis]|uniref:Uncharacterized protein n=1 Tax=Trichonephila inaurata madagascariensis TaxID=2747483 RepID=A0A8X6Y0Z2_9ARAC|nr:hypothetical protein TNIN_311621 [Trichonephila inaurata madagascariensis]
MITFPTLFVGGLPSALIQEIFIIINNLNDSSLLAFDFGLFCGRRGFSRSVMLWALSVWSTPAEPYDGKEAQELMKMAAFSDGSCC